MKSEKEKELEKYFGMTWRQFAGWNKSVKTKKQALDLLESIMKKQKSGLYKAIQL